MENLILFLLSALAPLRKLVRDFFIKTLCRDSFALIDLPPKFLARRFQNYDGTSDLDDHVAHYKQAMLTASLHRKVHEACFNKLFGNIISSLALKCYMNL